SVRHHGVDVVPGRESVGKGVAVPAGTGNHSLTGYAPVAGAPWLASFAQTRPFAEAFRNLDKGRTGGSQFLAELRALPTEEWSARLRRLISDSISLILRRSVDPDRPLSEYGLDSLGSLELRTRIETETGIRISAMGITTIRALAESLTETLADEATASTPS
ncbi:acyl carrier protein, partial [Mycolicibacterium porcinum]|uniref:acyl carrier protein n=1 Tax=Mycolicibacterium porcinum TaxID=39693 RepID=UPI000A4FE106